MQFYVKAQRRFTRNLILTLSLFIAVAALAQGQNVHQTSTPIKHVVVIFQENVSFDHYFATYPKALNPAGEPRFVARPGTPTVNGLSAGLLTANPNLANPFRFSRSQAATCDQDHNYNDEQTAFDKGAMDKFVEVLGTAGTDGNLICNKTDVMGYYDGNTVTAFWNYAQHFAMSDNSYGTTFGPSTPGALNLVAGSTATATPANLPGAVIGGSVIGDPRPSLDDCSPGGGGQANEIVVAGTNIGEILTNKGITWGFFQGGFKPTAVVNGKAVCGATHTGSDGLPKGDYIPHHEPFQYFAQTTNQHHVRPNSVANIGQTDDAKHQYDSSDFFAALNAGNFPEVVFLKAPGFQDGHAGYSDPLAEQTFVVNTINRLQQLQEWRSTAVFIAYDDSDGWYDHQLGPILTPSTTLADTLTGPGTCGNPKPGAIQGQCGLGPRLPLLVVSPFAKSNFVDSTTTDQSSILRFIEDNWGTGRISGTSADNRAGTVLNMFDFRREGNDSRKLFLNPSTGQPVGDDND
ncbi:MAG: phospholipase [Candidatus Angelobacter sp.]|nr:phospholipase [Candidatus Angelobacter sp.]